ncbi:Cysteine-rich secretory protein family protein [Ferrimonas sediminum]|uniref:Cysteine-rich secretory protein family protein n=1 Tax=Ferrimonas sediminum TaxID=718193 RepID=A0A1G8K6N4_9GAMM|nr:CAP domain-containing protein [Ferrimonas sediminum]SDI38999.1 Cysteine-rich secretory protein family protein [Ferrimonas sediminum]
MAVAADEAGLSQCRDNLPELVERINAIRASGQLCGEVRYPAVAPLEANTLLQQAAWNHASNMANYNFLSHTGLDGSDVGQRVIDLGYEWQFVGENIAAGQPNVDTAVKEWLASPGHCQNLMSPEYRETGVACVANSDSEYGFYWTQVFAVGFD